MAKKTVKKAAKKAVKKAVKKPAKKAPAKKAKLTVPPPGNELVRINGGPVITAEQAKEMAKHGMTVTPEPKRKVGKSPALAAPYGMTPAVHDFATAFKSMMAGPPKRSAASLLGDEAPPQINGVTLRELVTTFIADNKRFGEITSYAKAAGFDAQAFAIVAVLHLPYMRETKAAVELYTKMLAEP